jgi:hypothetical protein
VTATTTPAVRIIALIRRKPGTTREEFIEHYEHHHARQIAGHKYKWMSDYTRNYVIPGNRDSEAGRRGGTPADCDVITVASAFTDSANNSTIKPVIRFPR